MRPTMERLPFGGDHFDPIRIGQGLDARHYGIITLPAESGVPPGRPRAFEQWGKRPEPLDPPRKQKLPALMEEAARSGFGGR